MSDDEERGWVEIRTLADVLGITPQAARQTHVRRLAPEHIRPGTRQRPTRVYGPAVVQAIVRAAIPRDIDADLAGPSDSPGLERYRLAKAKLAEMELVEKQRILRPAAWWRQLADVSTRALRRIPGIVRRLPPDVQAEFLAAVDEAQAEILRHFGAGNGVARCECHLWPAGGGDPIVTVLEGATHDNE